MPNNYPRCTNKGAIGLKYQEIKDPRNPDTKAKRSKTQTHFSCKKGDLHAKRVVVDLKDGNIWA